MAFEHVSVLAREVLEGLDPRANCVYVDGTLGGAGHARAILEAANCTLIGIDRDPMALAAARAHLAGVEDRATLVHGQYSEIADILTNLGIDQVDGILLDLGVSSPQLDHADRGFSFMKPGPLDMRMDPTRGQTALELIESTDVDSLGDLICELGEERYGRRIARLIKDAADAGAARDHHRPRRDLRAGDPGPRATQVEDPSGDAHLPRPADRGQRRAHRARALPLGVSRSAPARRALRGDLVPLPRRSPGQEPVPRPDVDDIATGALRRASRRAPRARRRGDHAQGRDRDGRGDRRQPALALREAPRLRNGTSAPNVPAKK
jgi:hypothetical protein